MFILYKCLEDIDSMFFIFKEICRIYLRKYLNSYIVFFCINFDIVENYFC